jgi:chromosome segregation ATPase
MTAIYEAKLIDAKSRRSDLEKTVRSLEEQLLEAQERRNQNALSPSEALKEADTAAMIDNENLKAQVAHQQKKIVSLEDQNEELQVQIEKYDEAAIKANEKARDNERRLKEEITSGRSEISNLREQVAKQKDRIAELTHALKDQGNTLASAQAEIESNRVDLAVSEFMILVWTMLTFFIHAGFGDNARGPDNAHQSSKREICSPGGAGCC